MLLIKTRFDAVARPTLRRGGRRAAASRKTGRTVDDASAAWHNRQSAAVTGEIGANDAAESANRTDAYSEAGKGVSWRDAREEEERGRYAYVEEVGWVRLTCGRYTSPTSCRADRSFILPLNDLAKPLSLSFEVALSLMNELILDSTNMTNFCLATKWHIGSAWGDVRRCVGYIYSLCYLFGSKLGFSRILESLSSALWRCSRFRE